MRLGKREYRLLLGLVIIGVVLSWVLNNSGIQPGFFLTVLGLFYPFILGIIFAYLFNIPMRQLELRVYKRFTPGKRRVLSFFTTLLLLLALVGLLVFLVIPQLLQSVIALAVAMPGYVASAKAAILPYLDYLPMVQDWVKSFNIDWAALGKQAAGLLQTGGTAVLNSTFSFASSLISGTINFIVAAFFAMSLLFSKERLLAKMKYFLQAFLPEKHYYGLLDVSRLANYKFSRFVTAECIEALVLGVIYFLVLGIGGFQYALLISVLAAVFSLVPIFGYYIAFALGGFVTLVSMGLGRFVAFTIIFFVLQRVESSFLFRRIVGDSIGLSSTWILIAVTLGGGLFGIPGVLFFIPLTSLVYALLERAALKRRTERGLPVRPVQKK